jgi:putative tricarboxylic transport membrane protein
LHLSDRTSGVGLAVLGAVTAYAGSRLPPVPGQDVGPAVFPMVVGIGLAACGVMIALGVGRSFEAPETEAEAPAETGQPSRMSGLRALLPPVLLIFYVLASEWLGFLLTAALMVLAVSLALGARPRLALPLAILTPPFVHAVFAKLLRVPLPDGLLAMPW